VSYPPASHFDLSHFRYYAGPNPYLNQKAIAFNFGLQTEVESLNWENYRQEIGKYFSGLNSQQFNCYGGLFAQTVSFVSKLDMGLHLQEFRVTSKDARDYQIAVESLHHQTLQEAIYLVGDWFEAIAEGRDFNFHRRMNRLQEIFSDSPYGGPTSYAILKAAYLQKIPFFYLPEERLIQYGYGKNQRRGFGTTFDVDSHLDSDFTTQKDDCKDFLANCGFPIPQGKVVYSEKDAVEAAAEIGYPVAIKPVSGHKGIGVTANIQDEKDLCLAFRQINPDSYRQRIPIIVEKNIKGGDFRLLCVGGKFVAGLERRPPFVVGDGKLTIRELIEQENATVARQDTPTSTLTKIRPDQRMDNYLAQQRLSLSSIPDPKQIVYLSQVANISGGGISVDVTDQVHPDNQKLAASIAQYFRLVCLGVDVITEDISQSWHESELAVLEINAAPGVFMHLHPAIGKSVDVPSQIITHFFPSTQASRIPIITGNHLEKQSLSQYIETILSSHSHWLIGGICREGMFLNHAHQALSPEYNINIEILLRHPQLDCLIAEYPEEIFASKGTFYQGSNLIILDNPTEIENILARDILPEGILIIKQGHEVLVKKQESEEKLSSGDRQSFCDICCQQISQLLNDIKN
jgi:cyanophycin synthetase